MFCYFSYQQLMERGQVSVSIIFNMISTLKLNKPITLESCFSDLSIVTTLWASKMNKAINFLHNNTVVKVALI